MITEDTLRSLKQEKPSYSDDPTEAHFERLYTDKDYFDSFSRSPEIAEALDASLFPDADRLRYANQAYLATALNVPVEQLDNTYEAERDGASKSWGGKQGGTTDVEFFNLIAQREQKKLTIRSALNEIPGDIVAARFQSGNEVSSAELLQQWKIKHADLIPAEGDESATIRAAALFFAENDDWMTRYAKPAKMVFDTLDTWTKGFDPETMKQTGDLAKSEVAAGDKVDQLAETLAAMPREDRMKLYGMAALYAQRNGDTGSQDFPKFLENISVSIERSINSTLVGLVNVERDRNATPQQREAIQISRELRQVANGSIDPIKPILDGWKGRLEEGAYNAAGSLPYIAAATIPVAGAPLAIAAYSGQEYDRMRLEYPDIPIETVQKMALVSGSVQGALDKLQAEAVLGKLPVTGALLKQLAKPSAPLIGRIAFASGLNFAEQYGQETAQNLTPLVVDETARALGADMPERDWEKAFADFEEGQTQTFFALLPFWLVGTGAIGLREVGRGAEFAGNVNFLEKAGIDTDTAESIASETDPDKQEAKLHDAWKNISPDDKRRLIAETDAVNSQAEAIQNSPDSPTVQQMRTADGETQWVIRNPEGREIYRTKDEDAAVAAFGEAASASFNSTRKAVADMVTFFEDVNQRAGRGETQTFEIKDAPRTLQTVLSQGDVPIETLQERMRIAGIDLSTPLESVRVLGENVGELRDNVFHDTIRLHQGANPLTVVEERVEGEAKRAISEGRITMDWLRQQVSDYEISSGETLLTDTDQSVFEAVSTLGNAYVAGRVRDEVLPNGLRTFLRSMVEYFKDIFARAGRLRKAFTEGKVGRDFEQFLAQSVGLDEQAEVGAVRDAELARTFGIELSSRMPEEKRAAETQGQPSPGGLSAEDWIARHTANQFDVENFSDPRWAPKVLGKVIHVTGDGPVKGILIKTPKRSRASDSQYVDVLLFPKDEAAQAELSEKVDSITNSFDEDYDDVDNSVAVAIRISDHQSTDSARSTPDIDIRIGKPTGGRLGRGEDTPDFVAKDLLDAYQNLVPLALKYVGAINQKPDIAAGSSESVDSRLAAGGSKPIEQSQNSTPDVNPESRAPEGGATYSIAPADYTARIEAELKKLDSDPEIRRQRVEMARRKLSEIRSRVKARAPISAKDKTSGIEAAKLDHTEELRQLASKEAEAIAGVESPKERNQIKFSFTAKRRAVEAKLERRIAELSGAPISREGMLRSLGELEAILMVLPPDARGRIGGFRKLAEFKTDKGRASYLSDRIARVGQEMEKYLRSYYDGKLKKLLDRAKPAKDAAGKKKVGKAGAEIHALFDTLREAVDWTPEEADAHIAGIEKLIASGELTPEQEAHATLEAALVPLLADWKNADAARREAAVTNAGNVWSKGYSEYRTAKLAEKEARDRKRSKLVADTGKTGSAPERDDKALADNGLKGDWKDSLLGLLNFEQSVKWVFGDGSKEAERIADMERKASNAKDDAIFEKMNRLDDLFASLAGGRLAGEKLWWRLGQKTLDVHGRKLSELEAISALLMWQQEDGRRHMLGKVNENGKPIGPWRYDQSFVDDIEAKLSPDARAVMDFLTAEYSGEWETLNPIYRALNGIDLPRNENYAPLTVKPVQAQGGQTVDPVTGTTMTGASTTPGSLRTRGNATAEPDFRDALQVFIAHARQMEHWKAYAKFSNEARALINNREVGNAIEAKSGDQAVKVLRNWLDYFAQGGTRDAAAFLAMTGAIERAASRAASVALVGRIGTLAIQSTQLGAASAEMPLTSYLGRLGGLLSGQLGWHAAFESPYIQRRLEQMPPSVRVAMDGLRAAKPNALRHGVQKLARLISGADALFTAGTYAIVYDYQLKQLGDEADARAAAERIVDRIAQPTRAGARSFFENATTNPLARVGWAFASEARKNFGLMAYAAAQRSPKDAARAVMYVFVFNAFVGALIRNAWRDLRDSDDEEIFDESNWGIKRMAIATVTEPFYGVPVFGEMVQNGAFRAAGVWTPEGSLFSSPTRAISALRNTDDLFSGDRTAEEALRDLDAILTGAGLFNRDIAAAASLTHLARDLFGVSANLATSAEEK